MINRWQLPPEAAGQRFDVALAAASGRTRSALAKLFKAGSVLVDGHQVSAKQVVQGGEMVEVTDRLAHSSDMAEPDLTILFQNDDLIAVDKPAGLVVHLSETGRPQPTIAAFAAAQGVEDDDGDRPGIVHRLDKDTSGVLLIAKHPGSKRWLQQAFRDRQVKKTYQALVRGRLQPLEATIDLPIGRSRKQPTKRAVVPGARRAVTHYRTTKLLDGYSLVDVDLETGRTHQIRVHLAHLGHPVAGDSYYGGPKIPGLSRQFLHASRIELRLPEGEQLVVDSPLPPELQGVLNDLKKAL